MCALPPPNEKPARWSERNRLNVLQKAQITMQDIAAGTPGRQGRRRPDATAMRPRRLPVPTHSDRPHELASRVERLGVAGRTDPEAVVLGKFVIAGELRELARAIGP